MKDAVASTLATYRKKTELTQEELAGLVNVSRQTILAIEKGHYTPSVSLALRLARVFKIPVEKLFHLI